MKKTCEMCGWCRVFRDERDEGIHYCECHRNAATPIVGNHFGFPYVRPDDFCRKWAAREEVEMSNDEIEQALIGVVRDCDEEEAREKGIVSGEEGAIVIHLRPPRTDDSLTIHCPRCFGAWKMMWIDADSDEALHED